MSAREEEGLAEAEVALVDIGVDGMEEGGMDKGSNNHEEDKAGHISVEEVPLEAAWAALG